MKTLQEIAQTYKIPYHLIQNWFFIFKKAVPDFKHDIMGHKKYFLPDNSIYIFFKWVCNNINTCWIDKIKNSIVEKKEIKNRCEKMREKIYALYEKNSKYFRMKKGSIFCKEFTKKLIGNIYADEYTDLLNIHWRMEKYITKKRNSEYPISLSETKDYMFSRISQLGV